MIYLLINHKRLSYVFVSVRFTEFLILINQKNNSVEFFQHEQWFFKLRWSNFIYLFYFASFPFRGQWQNVSIFSLIRMINLERIRNSRDITYDNLKSRNPQTTTTNKGSSFVTYAVRYNKTLIDWIFR